MLAVLCHAEDQSALWAFDRLRRRRPAELIFVEALETPPTCWCYQHVEAAPTLSARLANGAKLETGRFRAVLNRMSRAPYGALQRAHAADAQYAQGEMTAFALSWLAVIAPIVVNRPTPRGLAGQWRTPLEWRVLGARAGFAVEPLTLHSAAPSDPADGFEPSTTILTIAGEALRADVPQAVRAAVRRIAAAAATPILGLRFGGVRPGDAGWRLLDATPQPDLSLAGDAGIAALEHLLIR